MFLLAFPHFALKTMHRYLFELITMPNIPIHSVALFIYIARLFFMFLPRCLPRCENLAAVQAHRSADEDPVCFYVRMCLIVCILVWAGFFYYLQYVRSAAE